MLHKSIQPNKNSNLTGGFGLIELMVSIGIVVLVMGIIVTKHSSYNSAVLLRSQAYSVALQVREIQLAAVSASGEVNPGNFRNVLGLYFSENNPNFYYNYRDNGASSNLSYNSGEEFGRRNNIDPRFQVDNITVIGGSTPLPDNISIVFERPNFDARFFTNTGELVGATAVEIDIRLKGTAGTGAGEVRTVEITKTGQITVKN